MLNETSNIVEYFYQTLLPTTGTENISVNGSRAAIGLQDNGGTHSTVHSGTVASPVGIRWTPLL